MSGLGIRLYTDEDVDPQLAQTLHRLNYEVISCHEAGNARRGFDDEQQLNYAIADQRAILTFNAKDFVGLDRVWKAQAREHYGIVLAENQTPLGELIRRVRLHLDTVSPEYQYNVLLFLPR